MKCGDCPYCWKGADDDFECCHCPIDTVAPCELDDVGEEE